MTITLYCLYISTSPTGIIYSLHIRKIVALRTLLFPEFLIVSHGFDHRSSSLTLEIEHKKTKGPLISFHLYHMYSC